MGTVTNAGAVALRRAGVVVEVDVVVVVAAGTAVVVVVVGVVAVAVAPATAPPLGAAVVELEVVDELGGEVVVDVVVLTLAAVRVCDVSVCVVRVGGAARVVVVTAPLGVVELRWVADDPPPPQAASATAATEPSSAATMILDRRDGCRSQSRRAADMLRVDGSESDGLVGQRRRVGAALRIGVRTGHCRALRRSCGFSSPVRGVAG